MLVKWWELQFIFPKLMDEKSVSEVMGITLYIPKIDGCKKGMIDNLGLSFVKFI